VKRKAFDCHRTTETKVTKSVERKVLDREYRRYSMASPTEKIINPNEHLEIPKWINEEYFLQVLQKDEPEYKKILNFKPVAAIPPGENFTSIMLRIHFDLQMKGEKKFLNQKKLID